MITDKNRHNMTCTRRALIAAIRKIRDKEIQGRIAKALADELREMNRGALCMCMKCQKAGR